MPEWLTSNPWLFGGFIGAAVWSLIGRIMDRVWLPRIASGRTCIKHKWVYGNHCVWYQDRVCAKCHAHQKQPNPNNVWVRAEDADAALAIMDKPSKPKGA
jgi:hypothetical protein